MDKRKKNIKSALQGWYRYLRDALTGKERNTFEREFQRDPFLSDAFDGFTSLSEENALKDLSILRNKLEKRASGGNRTLIYRIAASVAVLIGLAVILFLSVKNKPKNILAENLKPSTPIEIQESRPVIDNTLKQPEEKDKSAPSRNNSESNKQVSEESANEIVSDKTERNSEQKSDKQVQEPPQSYVTSRSLPAAGASASYTPPRPVSNTLNFNNYTAEKKNKSESALPEYKVVVLNFLVHLEGTIDSIKIKSSPGELYSNQAIKMLKEGPAWIPAQRNGQPLEDTISLVFRLR